MRKRILNLVLLLTASSPLLFVVDNLELNPKLDYTRDSQDGPLITGDERTVLDRSVSYAVLHRVVCGAAYD
jgi:hypothetical protein